MARTAPFKQVYTALQTYIETNKVVLQQAFGDEDVVPKELHGRRFLFNTSVGKNEKKQNVGVILVVEQRGPSQVPFFSMHSVIDKKDMRMTVQFFGADKLTDTSVDFILNGIKAYVGVKPGEQQTS